MLIRKITAISLHKLYGMAVILFALALTFLSGYVYIVWGSESKTQAPKAILEVEQSVQFDGKSFISDDFSPNLLNQPYTVQFLLKSEENDAIAQYDRNTPPMPMSIGPIAVYQISSSEYKIIVRSKSDNEETSTSIVLSDANQWKHIALVISENTVSFFDNGVLVKEDTGISPLISPKAIIGKGFLERFWKGEIAYAGISVGEQYEDVFTPPTNVSDLDDSIKWIYLYDGMTSSN